MVSHLCPLSSPWPFPALSRALGQILESHAPALFAKEKTGRGRGLSLSRTIFCPAVRLCCLSVRLGDTVSEEWSCQGLDEGISSKVTE